MTFLAGLPSMKRRVYGAPGTSGKGTQGRAGTAGTLTVVMSASSPAIHRDPEIQGGAPVFQGTRVPLRNLIDYLEAGDSLEVFLDDFPSVLREQAVAALEEAAAALEAQCVSS